MREMHNENSRRYMFQSKMKLTLAVSVCLLYLSSNCAAETNNCEKITDHFGVIKASFAGVITEEKCWVIVVPEDSYVRLDLTEIRFVGRPCLDAYVKFSVVGGNEEYKFCSSDLERKPVTVLNDVRVTYHHSNSGYGRILSGFILRYAGESLICAKNGHFRCSEHHCIHQHQVCDGVKNCENGTDEASCEYEVTAIAGVNTSRKDAVTWLKNQRTDSYAWGENTHRAITAMYLLEGDRFQEEAIDDNLLTKQLERQIAVGVIRKSDDLMSVSDLSMFINALSVTCRSSRTFYGHDLLLKLFNRVRTIRSPSPGAILTLCNANWTISDSQIRSLLSILSAHSGYFFHLDIQAMSLMALTCIKNKMNTFYSVENATEIYNTAINSFISHQQPDGSFGNVYRTAVVAQALFSSGRENRRKWDLVSTIQYLMRNFNSTSIDFPSVYFVAPIFNGKSLVDMEDIRCKERRKRGDDKEISDIMRRSSDRIRVNYILYIGDKKEVQHSVYVGVARNSSAHDVMRIAQEVDHKYKFRYIVESGNVYVYEIAGIANDPQTGNFWIMHRRNSTGFGTLYEYTQSPDKLFLNDDTDYVIMWYKTSHI